MKVNDGRGLAVGEVGMAKSNRRAKNKGQEAIARTFGRYARIPEGKKVYRRKEFSCPSCGHKIKYSSIRNGRFECGECRMVIGTRLRDKSNSASPGSREVGRK